MATNTDKLALRQITESDNWSAVVDKINFNFDQVKAYGGGDKGEPGFRGFRGLPGATGIGKKGDTGDTGATIRFLQVAISDGQPVTDAALRVGDVVIDSNGSFFTVITNNLGNPVFKFEYSLASAVAGSIVQTENQVFSQSTNPIIKWYLRDTGNIRDSNAMFVDRVVGTVTDEAQLYRAVIGDVGYPMLQNASMVIVNILPNGTVASAKENFFGQIALKYRSAPNSNVSSNTGYLRYFELNKNEATPVGADDTYMTFENVSAGFGAVHDSVSSDASYALIRGKTTRFMGKAAMNSLYVSGSLNNSITYLDVVVAPETGSILMFSPQTFIMRSTNSVAVRSDTKWFEVNAPKSFYNGPIYVGTSLYNGNNTFAPANGIQTQGPIFAGYGGSFATPSTMNAMLAVGGDIYASGAVIALGGGSNGNLEHIWVDDNEFPGVGGVFHMVADAGYKAQGNAGLQIARLWASYRADVTSGITIGPQGWRNGPEDGSLSVYGQGYFRSDTYVDGKFWGRANAEFNGVVAFETNNVYTRFNSQVDLRDGERLYIGGPGRTYSIWRYWNGGGNRYEWLGFRGDVNRWRLSFNGLERELWHSGYQGSGTGLDADLLDGFDNTAFWRKNIADSGSYMQFFGNEPGGALYLHQNNGAAAQIQRWYFGNTLVAYMQVSGILYAADFYILSDKKLKKDIKSMSSAREIINKLRPVHFKWKKGDEIEKSGFIAQEVEEIIPNMVRQGEMGLSMSNSDLIPYLVKGLQEAFAEIDRLKKLLGK